jgi:hypothetical protein
MMNVLWTGHLTNSLTAHWLQMWLNTLEEGARYRPREAAEHAQRLQAYVASAAARAGRQLGPGLKKELYEVLGVLH